MQEPTIVTGFFDLNREKWANSGRSNQRYLDAFSFWASIKNNIVIYTNKEMADEVKRIRNEKKLLDRTKIVIVEDYTSLDPELYRSISNAMHSHSSLMFHLKPNHPESHNADYNYVMLLKWWCVLDAIRKGYVDDTVAWIDFGFNNCGTYYTNASQFDFTWQCELNNKINLFCINKPDDTPIFEIVQKMETYVQGCSIVGPTKLWPRFAKLVRESMLEMNHVGFADDDQVYMLMAYRKCPEIFKLHYCKWFSIFSILSNQQFDIAQEPLEPPLKTKLKKLRERIKYYNTVRAYLKRQKEILLFRNVDND